MDMEDILATSKAMGERNDCSIRAITVATQTPYSEVHRLLKSLGRKNRRAVSNKQIVAACQSLGFAVLPYPTVGKTVRTIVDKLPPRGAFLIFTSGHVLCCRQGRVYDWTEGRLHRVRRVCRVVRYPRENNF